MEDVVFDKSLLSFIDLITDLNENFEQLTKSPDFYKKNLSNILAAFLEQRWPEARVGISHANNGFYFVPLNAAANDFAKYVADLVMTSELSRG